MTNLLFSIASAFARQATARFTERTRQVTAQQDIFLRSLLQAHRQTEFGRAFGLADLKSVDQFREQVPVLSYRDYEPYIERVARGEPQVLTVAPVIYLCLSSGTTGNQKLIPLTRRSRQLQNNAKLISTGFAAAALRQRQRLLGKILLTYSANLLGHTSGGIPYGHISAGDLHLGSQMQRHAMAHPFEALKISSSLARHYVCLLFALSNPHLGLIGATFPVLALGLCDYLENYAEDLIQDLNTGTIASWLTIEPALRAKLERQWTAQPQRAAQLRALLKTAGRLTPKLAWEELSLIVTARGGTSAFYLERFPGYFGDTPIFGGLYAASEATFGIYHEPNNDGAILAIDTGFFEFIPVDQWQASQPKTLLPCEVTPGHHYRILVTNYNGLYRYDIGDIVKVVGFYEQTPLIVFQHRLGGLLSSTSEKTTEFHVVQVMQLLQQDFKLSLENFCVTLSEREIPPHYLVNIELAVPDQITNPQAFIQQFDRRLRQIHVPYEIRRRDQVPPPRLRILAPGSFATVRQRLLQRGIPEAQLKFPHISEDRQFLAGLAIEQEIEMQESEAQIHQ